jgi:hypothetical protein
MQKGWREHALPWPGLGGSRVEMHGVPSIGSDRPSPPRSGGSSCVATTDSTRHRLGSGAIRLGTRAGRWKCSRVFFHRRACGPHLPSPSASARAARWYASGWISWAMSRAWRPIPKAQVADLAMAGIQIDRTKTGVAVRRGRVLRLAARRLLRGSLERADITRGPVFRPADEPDREGVLRARGARGGNSPC